MRLTISILILTVFFSALFIKTLPVQAAVPGIHDAAPDFELADLHGSLHRLSDYRGRVVVLNFWATWCPDCVNEMPGLEGLYQTFKGSGLQVIGVSIDRSKSSIEHLMPKVSYPILIDENGAVFVKKYVITRLPATIIIDRNGIIIDKLFGARDFSSKGHVEMMTRVLQNKSTP